MTTGQRFVDRFKQPLCLVWDDSCAFCARSQRLAKRLDWLNRIHPIGRSRRDTVPSDWTTGYTDEQGNGGMYLKPIGSNTPYWGFYAVRRLMWVLPLGWLTLPLWYLPGVSCIGNRVYGWIARNRKRWGCESDACQP